jgi:hypothetical protein
VTSLATHRQGRFKDHGTLKAISDSFAKGEWREADLGVLSPCPFHGARGEIQLLVQELRSIE